ncbi:MAG: O-antigen ligase family protein [Actinobacteria bacterium]|nr:O-antigen ligase family protein [Actinomycetota bacterium]
MSVRVPTGPTGALGGVGIRAAVLVLVAAVAAGALAAYAPVPGVLLAVALVGVMLVRVRTLPELGRAAVLVALITAIIGPNLGVPGHAEVFAFRLVAVLIILGIATWLLMGRGLPVPNGLGMPMALVAGWVGWALVSISWAGSTTDAIRWTTFLIISSGVMLAIPIMASSRRYLSWVLGALAAAFVLSILGALAEVFAGVHFPASALTPREGAFAATSFFGNQNNFATYLSLTLPYLVLLPVVARDARVRILGAAGAIVAIVFILFSGSKANLVAVGIILIGMLVVLATDRSMRRAFVASVVVVGAALALIIPSLFGAGIVPIPEQAVAKLSFSTLQAQVSSGQGSGAVRSTLLTKGIDIAAGTGGVGVGAGNAENTVRSENGYEGVANLHNWTLEVLVDTGVVGLVLYAALYIFMLVGCFRAARGSGDPLMRYMGLAGLLALLGFITGSVACSTVIAFAPMWITFGLCLATIVLARRAGPDGRIS